MITFYARLPPTFTPGKVRGLLTLSTAVDTEFSVLFLLISLAYKGRGGDGGCGKEEGEAELAVWRAKKIKRW